MLFDDELALRDERIVVLQAELADAEKTHAESMQAMLHYQDEDRDKIMRLEADLAALKRRTFWMLDDLHEGVGKHTGCAHCKLYLECSDGYVPATKIVKEMFAPCPHCGAPTQWDWSEVTADDAIINCPECHKGICMGRKPA